MSENNEHYQKFVKLVSETLGKDGFQTIRINGADKGIDFLAIKAGCVFAVQVKAKPLESFDIINESTITKSTIRDIFGKHPEYRDKSFVPVLVSGSMVNESSKNFAREMGVIVTESGNVASTLDAACATAAFGVSVHGSAEVREKKEP